MSTQVQTKYLDYELFEKLNRLAVKRDYNRFVEFEKLPINKHDVYPVVFAIPHDYAGETAMRCKLVLNSFGETAWLDVPLEYYSMLPEA